MPFEILGEITDIETFAVGSGIRELARLRKFMDVGVGANARVLPGFDYLMARSRDTLV
jgi:hypothetical protein